MVMESKSWVVRKALLIPAGTLNPPYRLLDGELTNNTSLDRTVTPHVYGLFYQGLFLKFNEY